MEIIYVVLLCIFIFLIGCLVGAEIMDRISGINLRERISIEKEWSSTYQKERDKFYDKYCEERDKNKLYKLWIYEHIRDKRSD